MGNPYRLLVLRLEGSVRRLRLQLVLEGLRLCDRRGRILLELRNIGQLLL